MKEAPAIVAFDALSIGDIAWSIRRHGRLIATLTVTAAIVGLLVVVALPATFTTTVSIMPQSSRGGGLSGAAGGMGAAAVASQFGFQLPTGDPGKSPAYYARLLATRDVLGAVYDAAIEASKRDTALATGVKQLVDRREKLPQLQRAEGIRRLEKLTYADLDQSTTIIVVSVKTHSAQLSYFVAQGLLRAINDHQERARQGMSEMERQFYEARVSDATAALHASEEAAVEFDMHNRVSLSPELQSAKERLIRDVNLRQTMFLSLSQNYEQARIDALHEAPNLSVVDPADFRFESDRKHAPFKALIVGLVGFLITSAVFVIRDVKSGLLGGRVIERAKL